MKTIIKLCVLGLLVFSFSCRDTKKEEAAAESEVNAMMEKIEAVESEVDSISEDIDAKAEALEAAIKELDSI